MAEVKKGTHIPFSASKHVTGDTGNLSNLERVGHQWTENEQNTIVYNYDMILSRLSGEGRFTKLLIEKQVIKLIEDTKEGIPLEMWDATAIKSLRQLCMALKRKYHERSSAGYTTMPNHFVAWSIMDKIDAAVGPEKPSPAERAEAAHAAFRRMTPAKKNNVLDMVIDAYSRIEDETNDERGRAIRDFFFDLLEAAIDQTPVPPEGSGPDIGGWCYDVLPKSKEKHA